MKKYCRFRPPRGVGVFVVLVCFSCLPLAQCTSDDQVPVTKTRGVFLSGTIGENGWYISPVIVTFEPVGEWIICCAKIDDGVWMELTTPIMVDSDGLHTLYWFYMDAEGHMSPTYSMTFGIDRTPPTVSLAKEKVGFRTFRVLVGASDGVSGVARLVVYVDDQLRAEIEELPFEYSWEGSGNHTIRAIAYDYAGFNASSSMTISYEQEELHQRVSHLGSLFHLQYVLTVSWNGQTNTPISNGETRMMNVTVQSTVTRGAFGRFLLWLLEGTPYRIHLSVEDTPEWCESWFSPENLSAVVHGGEMEISETSLGIHVSADAPGNYTMGWVICRASIESLTGPFHLCTLIHGFEQNFTITFINN